MAITGWKSNDWQRIASHGCPACDVISNIQKGAHVVICNHVHHIPGVYKRLCPSLRESFCSSSDRSTKIPHQPVSHCEPSLGTSVVYKVNSLGFSLFSAVKQDRPVGVSPPEHDSLGTDREL